MEVNDHFWKIIPFCSVKFMWEIPHWACHWLVEHMLSKITAELVERRVYVVVVLYNLCLKELLPSTAMLRAVKSRSTFTLQNQVTKSFIWCIYDDRNQFNHRWSSWGKTVDISAAVVDEIANHHDLPTSLYVLSVITLFLLTFCCCCCCCLNILWFLPNKLVNQLLVRVEICQPGILPLSYHHREPHYTKGSHWNNKITEETKSLIFLKMSHQMTNF